MTKTTLIANTLAAAALFAISAVLTSETAFAMKAHDVGGDENLLRARQTLVEIPAAAAVGDPVQEKAPLITVARRR